MAVADQLHRLEQLDAQIDRQGAELAEVRRRQERNPELEAADARLADLQVEQLEVAAELRSLEAELADLEARIKRGQGRLYGGTIVDPRELSSIERELEHHRSVRDALEERVLLAMDRLEGVQEAVTAASRRLEELRRRWEEDRPRLALRAERGIDDLAGLRAEREALSASIDARALDLYQRLRASSGHAVSEVSNGVCQWCRVVIPPKDVQHARSGDLVTCSNCARILYAG
jgi:predicted  nucleic acid-binding Zn-ribbon protein